MTNTRNLGTIEAANPVLAVAPLKEDAEMQRATDCPIEGGRRNAAGN